MINMIDMTKSPWWIVNRTLDDEDNQHGVTIFEAKHILRDDNCTVIDAGKEPETATEPTR